MVMVVLKTTLALILILVTYTIETIFYNSNLSLSDNIFVKIQWWRQTNYHNITFIDPKPENSW